MGISRVSARTSGVQFVSRGYALEGGRVQLYESASNKHELSITSRHTIYCVLLFYKLYDRMPADDDEYGQASKGIKGGGHGRLCACWL